MKTRSFPNLANMAMTDSFNLTSQLFSGAIPASPVLAAYMVKSFKPLFSKIDSSIDQSPVLCAFKEQSFYNAKRTLAALKYAPEDVACKLMFDEVEENIPSTTDLNDAIIETVDEYVPNCTLGPRPSVYGSSSPMPVRSVNLPHGPLGNRPPCLGQECSPGHSTHRSTHLRKDSGSSTSSLKTIAKKMKSFQKQMKSRSTLRKVTSV